MEFPDTLDIEGESYERVDIQRGRISAIYKTGDTYVRIGDPEKIKTDLAAHKEMEASGFPIAKLLGEGVYGDWYYFKEQSLGDHCFGLIFEDEYVRAKVISQDSWERFVSICEQFAKAQLSTRIATQPWKEFENGVHLDLACGERPEHTELFTRAFTLVTERLAQFPFVVTHGDLTPFNMYPGGVIDLEDSFMAPAGYDLMALIEHLEWFPVESADRLHQLYTFTTEQRGEFIQRIDTIYSEASLPTLSEFAKEFSFAKGIWFAVRLDNYPELQKFRYEHLIACATKLLESQAVE